MFNKTKEKLRKNQGKVILLIIFVITVLAVYVNHLFFLVPTVICALLYGLGKLGDITKKKNELKHRRDYD